MRSLHILGFVLLAIVSGVYTQATILFEGWKGGQTLSGPYELNFNHLGFGKLLNVNGDAYYLGGMTKSKILSEKVYIHVAGSHDTTTGVSLPLPLIGMAAAAVNGTTIIYICGGAAAHLGVATTSCFKLTADGSAWVSMPAYPEAIVYASMVILNGSPYVFGGARDAGEKGVTLTDSVYMYDDVSNAWRKMANMPDAAAYMGSTRFTPSHDSQGAYDRALLCGGWVPPKTAISSCNIYDTKTDSWIEAPAMNDDRAYGSLAWHQGRLYCAGGWGASAKNGTTIVEVFDPIAESWQVLSNLMQVGDVSATGIAYKMS